MSIVAPVIDTIAGTRIMSAVWTGLANGDTGAPMDYPEWADRNLQVFGTFGAGGSLTLQGSNDGSNWETLHDIAGSALTYSTAGVKMVAENVLYVRPSVTGDGTTALTAILIARRS